jgi:outer membrane protein assembly factor BamB
VFVLGRETLSGFGHDGTERWSVPVGEGAYAAGAPTAHPNDGWVALATSDGRLRLFDTRTGTVEFERTFAAELRASVVAPTNQRRMYVSTGNGAVHTLHRGPEGWTGQWTHEAFGGVDHAPAVGDDIVVATTAGVEVLDGQGRARWRRDLPAPAATRPTLVGETVLVGTHDHALYAFHVDTGERRWWRTVVEHPNPGERIEGVAATPERLYVTDSRAVHALSYDGQRRWRHHDWDRSFGPPVAVGDAVLAVDGEGISAFAPGGGPGVGSLRPDPVRWRFVPDGSPRGLAVVGDRAFLTVAREGEDELLVLS